MARTGGEWIKTVGGYIKTAYDNGVNVLINGENRYLNFNLSSGEAGYGIRDNNGTMEFKNADGSWTALGGGGGGSTEEEIEDIVNGLLVGGDGITLTYDDVGNTLTIALTDEAYTTAEKNKVANVPADTNTELAAKANSADLAAVALSGDYSDLSNTPDLSLYDNLDVYADSASFPVTGEADVLYVETNTGLIYRWTGADYAVISAQLALGETSSTAYRGDRGKEAYDHTFLTNNPHGVTAAQAGAIPAFADPNADRIVFWDDSAGAFVALTASTGLTISGTSMTVRAASSTQTGIVELATDAETTTGTDTTRAITPANLTSQIGSRIQAYSAALVSWAAKAIPSGVVVGTTDTQTISNKRKTPRAYTVASTATLTPEIATYDVFDITAQAAALDIANHSTSTPTDGEQMRIRIKDNGTARAISFGTNYSIAGGIPLPTTTTISKQMTLGFEWYAGLSKWVLTAFAQEA